MAERTVIITEELAEHLGTVLWWATVHVAETYTSRSADVCYRVIREVADALGVVYRP